MSCRAVQPIPADLERAGAVTASDPGGLGPFAVVRRPAQKLRLAGQTLTFDLFTPRGVARPPVVVVAHGFVSNTAELRGWGWHLASWGFAVAVPTFSHPSGPMAERNAESVLALLDWLAAQAGPGAADPPRGLVGHSFGGQVVLLAAARDPRVKVVVALDPVDGPLVDAALQSAKAIAGLSAVLRAEPSICNLGGSDQLALIDALPGPKISATVSHSTHCDPEEPSSVMCNLFCGPSDAARRKVFKRYATAALRFGLLGDPAARAWLDGAAIANDPGLSAHASAGFQPPAPPPL